MFLQKNKNNKQNVLISNVSFYDKYLPSSEKVANVLRKLSALESLGDINAVFQIQEYLDDDELEHRFDQEKEDALNEYEKDFEEVEALEKERAERLEGKGDTLEDLSNLEAEKK